MNKLVVSLLSILFAFACLYLFSRLFGPLPLNITSTASTKDLFSVQGTGDVDGTAQAATISVGVSKTAATTQLAQQQVTTIANQIIADIKQLGVPEKNIKTTNYSSYPVNPPTIEGSLQNAMQQQYTVSEDLEVTLVTPETAAQIIDTSTKDGATNVGGVQYNLTDATQQDLQNQARTKAITNAKQRAQTIASEAGLHLGQLVNVQETGSPYPVYTMNSAMDKAAPDTSTTLQPGQNKVQVTVTLFYQTY